MTEPNSVVVQNREIAFGVQIDPQTRCAHYHSPLDVVAIKFPCCNRFYSCYECHRDLAGHPAQRWTIEQQDETAILCGVCGNAISIRDYIASKDACPNCDAPFNPGCRLHRHLYFDF